MANRRPGPNDLCKRGRFGIMEIEMTHIAQMTRRRCPMALKHQQAESNWSRCDLARQFSGHFLQILTPSGVLLFLSPRPVTFRTANPRLLNLSFQPHISCEARRRFKGPVLYFISVGDWFRRRHKSCLVTLSAKMRSRQSI